MASNTSNFVVPLPPVVKVEVEEQVVPKDFRGYLTACFGLDGLDAAIYACLHAFLSINSHCGGHR